jgi:hypothetical protein
MVAPAWSLSVVKFAKEGVRTQGHLNCHITMERSPQPLALVLGLEELIQSQLHPAPGLLHYLFMFLLSLVGLVDVVVQGLLRGVLAEIADVVMGERTH